MHLAKLTFLAAVGFAASLVGCAPNDPTSGSEDDLTTAAPVVVGNVAYGQTATVDYKNTTGCCALKFTAQAGESAYIRADVIGTGYPILTILDDQFREISLAYGNGNGHWSPKAELWFPLPKAGTYYVRVAEDLRRPAKFTVFLDNKLPAPPPAPPTWSDDLAANNTVGLGGVATFNMLEGPNKSVSPVHARIQLRYRRPYNGNDLKSYWFVDTFSTDYAAPTVNSVRIKADGTFSGGGDTIGNSSWNSSYSSLKGRVLLGRKVQIDAFGMTSVNNSPPSGSGSEFESSNQAPFEIDLTPNITLNH